HSHISLLCFPRARSNAGVSILFPARKNFAALTQTSGDQRLPDFMTLSRPSMAVLHLHLARRRAAFSGANAFNGKIDGDFARFLKFQHRFDVLALLQRALQPDEHHMVSTRLQFDRLSRFDLESLVERTHFHHAVVHAHLVDLETAGDIRRAPDKAVSHTPCVRDRHVGAPDRSALWRSARPGTRNFQAPDRDIFGLRRANPTTEQDDGGNKRRADHRRTPDKLLLPDGKDVRHSAFWLGCHAFPKRHLSHQESNAIGRHANLGYA